MRTIPKVIIIMATYNRTHLIEETLTSIQNQTYTNWECLIIDDGGTDDTQEVIQSVLEKDNRFQYLKRPINYKKGLPGCRNYGLDLVKGKYVIFFDDDDLVHPQNLEICIDALKSGSTDFCLYQKKSFTGTFTGEYDVQTIKKSEEEINLFNFLTNQVSMASCTVMWHFSCFEGVRFNEDLMYAEEWECYTRILTSNKKGEALKNILYFNRKHKESNTGEFWNNDPVRRESKVEACKLVIEHLAVKNLLTYRLGVYFVSLAHFLNEKRIFNYLRLHKAVFNNFDYMKLYLRYFGNAFIRPIYKIKKRMG